MKQNSNACPHFQLFPAVCPMAVIDIDYPLLVLLMLCQQVSAPHLKMSIPLIVLLQDTQAEALCRQQSIPERFFMPEDPSIATSDTA